MTAQERFKDPWDALINHPSEAQRMRFRSQLMRELTRIIKGWNVSQQAAADKLEVNVTRVNQLLNGKIDKFSVDSLLLLLHKAGATVTITVETT